MAKAPKVDAARIQSLMTDKQQISLKIKQLRVDMQKVNIGLARAGATVADISCW